MTAHHAERPKILLTGRNGQVGWELMRTLAALGEITAVDIEDVDLSNTGETRAMVRRVNPALIVNPAAYTAVDRAESEPEKVQAINAAAPGVLAEEARILGIPIIHYSTDYVFDGLKQTPYTEEDQPHPTTQYGRSKLAGEEAVLGSGARHVILRLAWVYGMRGMNFALTMIRLARDKEEVRVVNDQTGAPTWSRMVAEASAIVAARLLREEGGLPSGVYHLPSAGAATWFDFAEAIFTYGAHRFLGKIPRVVPIPTSDYPTPAKRPVYSVLAGDKIRDHLGLCLPSWEQQLALAMQDASSVEGVFHDRGK